MEDRTRVGTIKIRCLDRFEWVHRSPVYTVKRSFQDNRHVHLVHSNTPNCSRLPSLPTPVRQTASSTSLVPVRLEVILINLRSMGLLITRHVPMSAVIAVPAQTRIRPTPHFARHTKNVGRAIDLAGLEPVTGIKHVMAPTSKSVYDGQIVSPLSSEANQCPSRPFPRCFR
jgi:hypothetical protein